MDQLSKQVEQEKREAIIVSNKLASLPNKVEEKMTMLQVVKTVKKLRTFSIGMFLMLQKEIEQKSIELDRYQIEHRSLQKIESEQIDFINQLSFQN